VNVATTLAFDTATSELTVAVFADDGSLIAEREVAAGEDGRPRHANALLPAIEEAVGASGTWNCVTGIVVGVGPGAFTGLRIGVATARALSQARGVTLKGISSLAMLAAGVPRAVAERERPRLAMLDARRGEVFAALYDEAGEMAWPAAVGAPEALAERIGALPGKPVAVGDGAVRFRDRLAGAGATIPPDGDPAHRLRARHAWGIAAHLQGSPPSKIEPNYLRRPDAELWRERDHKAKSSA